MIVFANKYVGRRQTAFTLVEVVVSIMFLATCLMTIYLGISGTAAVVLQSRENTRATQILEDRMEEIRLYTWDQISTFGTPSCIIPTNFWEPFFASNVAYTNSDLSTNAVAGSFYYYGMLSISSVSNLTDSYSNELRLVSVTLKWTNGVPRQRTISTYVSAHGLQNYYLKE